MRELLIRYLLGELEPHEHDAVQQQLAESAELRRELAHLRSCFSASCQGDEDPDGPPRGLAERTAERVSESGSHPAMSAGAVSTRAAALGDSSEPPTGALGWSLADLTVAGGVILAVSMLLFPAVRESRDGTRRDHCAFNMHQLGQLIFQYAESRNGYIPEVQPDENAGIYAVRLAEGEYARPRDLALLLICPGSDADLDVQTGRSAVILPTQVQLDAMPEAQLAKVRPWMSPSYAYTFGFRVGQQYYYVNSRRMLTPILSDTPAKDGSMSEHHGAIVQALYPDGSVRRFTTCEIQGVDDDMFRNAVGEVDAGYGISDAVLARSEETPRIFQVKAGR